MSYYKKCWGDLAKSNHISDMPHLEYTRSEVINEQRVFKLSHATQSQRVWRQLKKLLHHSRTHTHTRTTHLHTEDVSQKRGTQRAR